MKIAWEFYAFWFLLLFITAGGAAGDFGEYGLPAEVPMNMSAGRSGLLTLNLRLDGGEPLEFIVDTGWSGATSFEKSQIPKLGKRQGTRMIDNFGAIQESGLYAAPALWLGKVRLRTGRQVGTFDNRKLAVPEEYPTPGILGIDVLSHYCLQLDFSAGKVRFLDSDHADKRKWGHAYPLFRLPGGSFYVTNNLTGVPPLGSLIDTGCSLDGWLTPRLFTQWTNQSAATPPGAVHLPKGTFDGVTYANLIMNRTNHDFLQPSQMSSEINGIGLRFLARHLVTLDFPHRTLYLNRTTRDPLSVRHLHAEAVVAGHDALEFMWELQRRNQLPGWYDGEEPSKYFQRFNYSYLTCEMVTFNEVRKPRDPFVYHYEFMRLVPEDPWKLFRAWRADQSGRTLEEYPLP